VKGGWTTTASVDCGSGRPANGTPREALPQCAATAPPKTSRGTAGYCMARPARGEVYACLRVVRQWASASRDWTVIAAPGPPRTMPRPSGTSNRYLRRSRLDPDLVSLDTVRSVRYAQSSRWWGRMPQVQTRCASPTPLPSSVSVEDAGSKLSDAAADVRIAKETSPNFADDAVGLVARTVLYALPKTNAFDVRQMIDSNSTNVRIFSRYRHNTMC